MFKWSITIPILILMIPFAIFIGFGFFGLFLLDKCFGICVYFFEEDEKPIKGVKHDKICN